MRRAQAERIFADLRNKTAGIAALFQGCSDEKAVKKVPNLCRRAFRNTLKARKNSLLNIDRIISASFSQEFFTVSIRPIF